MMTTALALQRPLLLMRVLAAAAVLLALLLPALLPGRASANGVPQVVKLTYLPGISNWGPEAAEGVLEFSFAEAYARIDVKGLRPVQGYTYEAWLFAPDGDAFRVGTIAVDASGVGALETKLTNLADYDYDLLVVVGRTAGTPPGAVSDDWSIAGRFTVLGDAGTAGGATGDVRPRELPATGERPYSDRGRIIRTALTILGVGASAFVVQRLRTRRFSK